MRTARIDGGRLGWQVSALGGLLLAVSGCAGGAWLESPLESELPLEETPSARPPSAYPTAIRASLSDDAEPDAAPEVTNHPPATAPQPPATAPQAVPPQANPAPPAPQQRTDRHQPMLTPLATIPQEYVRPPPAIEPAVATPTAPQAAPPQHSPSAVDQWSATALLNLDSPLNWPATLPPPQALSTTPVTSSGIPSTSPVSRSSEKPAAEKTDSAADRRARLDKAREEMISALEQEIRQRRSDSTTDDELPRLEQQLRLIYLAAGRFDEAVSAVESLDASQRDAYKDLMFGLGVWISPDESRRSALRSAKVLHSLREATGQLAATSKLEVRNLVFCERVDHFGWYSEFPKKEFQPKQQVILYAEVENFSAEQKGSAGYETELQGSYEILDSSGQIVASRQLQLDKEVCRNYRRDYFLAYRIYMPDDISAGRYRLELTVEDLKARGKYQGRKLGDGVIEFTIR
jgi:hypothetical protein